MILDALLQTSPAFMLGLMALLALAGGLGRVARLLGGRGRHRRGD